MTPDDVIAVAGEDYVDWGEPENDTQAHIWFDSDFKKIKKPDSSEISEKTSLTLEETQRVETLKEKFKGDPYGSKNVDVQVYIKALKNNDD